MSDDSIVVLCGGLGCLGGAFLGFSIPAASAELVVVTAAGGTSGGVMLGIAFCTIRSIFRSAGQPKPTRPLLRSAGQPTPTPPRVHSRPAVPDAPAPRPVPPPISATIPFRTRLAAFTHQRESEVMSKQERFRSKMPFWSAVDLLARVPPKSAQLIRYYLAAIRRAAGRRDGS